MTSTATVVIIIFLCVLPSIHSIPPSKSNRKVVWQDYFNGNKLDIKKWNVRVDCYGIGGEQQCYTDRTVNLKVADGKLTITARVEDYQKNTSRLFKFTSGRLHGKQGFKYGYFEARAKMPKGKHLWPAIWMMPQPQPGKPDGAYGKWPRSGEIDILEYRGQEPTKVESTIHFGAEKAQFGNPDKGSEWSKKNDWKIGDFSPLDFSKDFHLFGLDWTPNKMTFYVDDKEYWSTSLDKVFTPPSGKKIYDKKGQPFDQPFHFIVNLAVGGGFFEPNPNVTPEEATQWPKPTLEVDYMKVYQ